METSTSGVMFLEIHVFTTIVFRKIHVLNNSCTSNGCKKKSERGSGCRVETKKLADQCATSYLECADYWARK